MLATISDYSAGVFLQSLGLEENRPIPGSEARPFSSPEKARAFFSSLSAAEKFKALAWFLFTPLVSLSESDYAVLMKASGFKALLEDDGKKRAEAFFNAEAFLSLDPAWQRYSRGRLFGRKWGFPGDKSFADLHNELRDYETPHGYSDQQVRVIFQFLADNYTALHGLDPVHVTVDELSKKDRRGGVWMRETRTIGIPFDFFAQSYSDGVTVLGHELEHAANDKAADNYAEDKSTALVDGLYYLNTFFYFELDKDEENYAAQFIEVACFAAQKAADTFLRLPLLTPAIIENPPALSLPVSAIKEDPGFLDRVMAFNRALDAGRAAPDASPARQSLRQKLTNNLWWTAHL